MQNQKYWEQRADGYSKYNQGELIDERKELWANKLYDLLDEAFPGRAPGAVQILDAGCGPGFFTRLLCEKGYNVTAVDFSKEMLLEARKNTGEYARFVTWLRGDVEELPFEDFSFDAVVSRNVTWNLPHPRQAYKEWLRVLKTGGCLLNFDANWYGYLVDEEKQKEYAKDRENVARQKVEDFNIGDNFDLMEEIAQDLPLTGQSRPIWDAQIMKGLGYKKIVCDIDVWKEVWAEIERVNNASTPQFLVMGRK